jgi:hypothetical protein
MGSVDRRGSLIGRWAPLALYAVVALGWFAEGLGHEAARDRLWLVWWTLAAPALYLWRTRRRR